jgi:hypothetical protein
MSPYPVHFDVESTARFTRVQLVVRLVALMVFGMLGISIGSVFAIAYLLLPIYAASRIASLGSAADYARRDGSHVLSVLRWFTAVSAWAGLATDGLPARSPEETVRLELAATTHAATPISALLRILTGLLSAAMLGLLGCLGVFFWLLAGLSILAREEIGPATFSYLVGLQRWGVRLLAHQACLVDQYPPFTLADGPRATDERPPVAV